MELTLDDYLAEFDRWKERAADKRKAREEAKQPVFSEESLIRMEKRIGESLPRAAVGEAQVTFRQGVIGEDPGDSRPPSAV